MFDCAPPGHIRAGLDDRSPARSGLAVGAANRQVMARFLLGSAPGPLVEQLASERVCDWTADESGDSSACPLALRDRGPASVGDDVR